MDEIFCKYLWGGLHDVLFSSREIISRTGNEIMYQSLHDGEKLRALFLTMGGFITCGDPVYE